jgi:hypothetical protein
LASTDAKSGWQSFVQEAALLQLSFVFDEDGNLAPLVGMDVEVMVGVAKLLSRSMNSRQLLAVAVYIAVERDANLIARCCLLATPKPSTTAPPATIRARGGTIGCVGYSSQEVTCEIVGAGQM